jgi:hypothetical protein
LVRVDHFQFGSVFIKKSNQTEFFFFLNRNRVQPTGFGSVWFFRAKTGSNRFGSVFPVLAQFYRFFSVWLGFSGLAQFFSVSVRFGLVFSVIFFFGFLRLIGFLVFLLTPSCMSGIGTVLKDIF